jgi:cyclic 2,3-diphosphoglycerate synthetase
VVATKFRPAPVADIGGARVLFATTADPRVASHLAAHLEAEHGCEVAAVTTHLSNRAALREELARHAGAFDLIVSELKAAAIDVVAAEGEAQGIPTVLCDNVPIAVDGTDLEDAIISVAGTALARGTTRKGARS